MPLIAKEVKSNRVNLQVRVTDQVVTDLDLYCRFLQSRKEYVVENLLAFAFKKDRDFQDWLATNQDVPAPALTSVDADAGTAASATSAATAARRRASTIEAA